MSKINNVVHDLVDHAMEGHFASGGHPEVQFSHSEGHVSFLLFERVDVGRRYFYAADVYIREELGIAEGIYSRKRNFPGLAEKLNQPCLTALDIIPGDIVKTIAVPQISRKYRTVDIDVLDMRDQGILEGMCREENGYYGEHGSFYAFELVMVYRDHFWRPVTMRAQDIELKKAVHS